MPIKIPTAKDVEQAFIGAVHQAAGTLEPLDDSDYMKLFNSRVTEWQTAGNSVETLQAAGARLFRVTWSFPAFRPVNHTPSRGSGSDRFGDQPAVGVADVIPQPPVPVRAAGLVANWHRGVVGCSTFDNGSWTSSQAAKAELARANGDEIRVVNWEPVPQAS